MGEKKKRRIQRGLLGSILLISFSFLFLYAKEEKTSHSIGISYIQHDLSIDESHVDQEKKASTTKEETSKNQAQTIQETKDTTPKNTAEDDKQTTQKQTTNTTKEKEDNTVNDPQEVVEETTKKEESTPQPQINTITFSIDMTNIIEHKKEIDPRFQSFIPKDGILISPTSVEIQEGDTAYDILEKMCKQQGIPIDASAGYVKYINHIGEFDVGRSSGWLYTINDVMPSVGSNKYKLQSGDVLKWRYTITQGDV